MRISEVEALYTKGLLSDKQIQEYTELMPDNHPGKLKLQSSIACKKRLSTNQNKTPFYSNYINKKWAMIASIIFIISVTIFTMSITKPSIDKQHLVNKEVTDENYILAMLPPENIETDIITEDIPDKQPIDIDDIQPPTVIADTDRTHTEPLTLPEEINHQVEGSQVSEELRKYTVRKRDTYYGIAKRELGNSSRYKELVKLNKTKPSSLRIGEIIFLPAKTTIAKAVQAGSINDIIHTVVAGDCLTEISSTYYGTSKKWKKIAKANNISDPSKLQIGQKLIIPALRRSIIAKNTSMPSMTHAMLHY